MISMKHPNLKRSQWIKSNIFFYLEHLLGENLFQKLLGKSERKFLSNVDLHLSKYENTKVNKILEVEDGNNKEALKPYQVKVFRNAASEWPAIKKWDFNFFKEQFGEKQVEFFNTPGITPRDTIKHHTSTFAQYIDDLLKGTQNYLRFSPLLMEREDLMSDFNLDWIKNFPTSQSIAKKYFLFIGAKGTKTPIHNAISHTAFIQIKGQKKFTVWDPSDRLFLNVRAERHPYFFSHADPIENDKSEYPLFKYANRTEIILNPGDVLFFPAYYFHYVENLTDSIGVAYKFVDFRTAWKSSSAMTILTFLCTKPTLIRSLWNARFNNMNNSLSAFRDYD